MQSSKVIYSLRVFLKLKELGYHPIATTENPNKPGFICWIYSRTPEFLEDLDLIMQEGGKNNGK